MSSSSKNQNQEVAGSIDDDMETRTHYFPNGSLEQADVAQTGNPSQTGEENVREAPPFGSVSDGTPTDESFCDDCKRLGLHGLTQRVMSPNNWVNTIVVAAVGHRYRQPQPTNCTLCRILAASRVGAADSEHGDDEGDEICAVSFLAMSGIYSVNKESMARKRDSVCLVVVPRSFFPHQDGGGGSIIPYEEILPLRRHFRSRGCAVMEEEGGQQSTFSVKEITPLFDPRIARDWRDYCTEHHGLLCDNINEPTALPGCGFRVIDCTTLSVEECKSRVPYVALSYVWGDVQASSGTVRHVGGRTLLPKRLSPVVRDAIHVTKALGYQYLWVDKFCIDQYNNEAKHQMIRHMDSVYHGSELTLIAAAGVDETYGLPGIGNMARARQLIAKDQGVTVTWTPQDPQNAIACSHWSTRGWTFQEAVLSRRRLVFTESQTYFECNTTNYLESIRFDDTRDDDDGGTSRHLRSGMFGTNRAQAFGEVDRNVSRFNDALNRYLSNVEMYSARTLRYDGDALNAFKGIIRRAARLRGQGPRLLNIWGLAYSEDGRLGVSVFVYSLSWRHKRRGRGTSRRRRRRGMFPSWSWVGWEGEVEYELLHDNLQSLDSYSLFAGVQDVCFWNRGGDVVRLGELADQSQDNSGYTILRLTAPVVPARLISYQPAEDSEWPASERLGDGQGWQCVYLACELYLSYVIVLELQPASDTWVRVGMFQVDEELDVPDEWLRTFDIE